MINRGRLSLPTGGMDPWHRPEGGTALPVPETSPLWYPDGIARHQPGTGTTPGPRRDEEEGGSPPAPFLSRALCPHPGVDPGHTAQRRGGETEARSPPPPLGRAAGPRRPHGAGLGICRWHNEHLCALKRRCAAPAGHGEGEEAQRCHRHCRGVGKPPPAVGSAHPGSSFPSTLAPPGIGHGPVFPAPWEPNPGPVGLGWGSGRGPIPREANPQRGAGIQARDNPASLREGEEEPPGLVLQVKARARRDSRLTGTGRRCRKRAAGR